MNSDPYLCKADLVRRCEEAGACAVGVAAIEPLADADCALYDAWLAQGRHGSMSYLENYPDLRANPEGLLPGAKTIVSCAFPYGGGERSDLFADYAVGSDYHEVLRKCLAPVAAYLDSISEGTRICIDTAPLRERLWAQRAGIGFIGLNNQLIIPGIGSRVFLAEILWTGTLPPDTPMTGRSCLGCRACIAACPGHALDGAGGMDARRCLSYLTIEHRGEFPDDLSLPGRIYGCDICQDVCPHNRGTRKADVRPEFAARPEVSALTINRIAAMEQAEFSRIFTHSAVKRTKLCGLQRNAAARRKK